MHGQVTNEEYKIFQEAYQFFAAHADPPANQDECAADWWNDTAKELGELERVWKDYPLMRGLLMAIFEYVECKAKEKTKEVAEFVLEQ